MRISDSFLKRAALLGSFVGGTTTAISALITAGSAAFIAFQSIQFNAELTKIGEGVTQGKPDPTQLTTSNTNPANTNP